MDLVVTSLAAWDSLWRRNQHLIAGSLRREPSLRVLFVEPAIDPLHAAIGANPPRRGRGLRPVPRGNGIGQDALWLLEPTKWLPRRVDRRADERWARQVLRAVRTLEMEQPVLWVDDPRGSLLVEATHWRSLYDVSEDRTLADRPTAEIERIKTQEHVLLTRCDEVVVSSPALKASKGVLRDVTVVPNGVETMAYLRDYDRPSDLPAGAVALYMGSLHGDHLDVELCVLTARALAGSAHLVLVGPDALGAEQHSRLEAAGVVLLGGRPSAAVPAYLQHAEVLVVPHLVTPFTDSQDPIKLYEYRAARRPVVSTPVASIRDVFDARVKVADSTSFVGAVVDALSFSEHVNSIAAKLSPGEGSDALDWTYRVDRMLEIVGRLNQQGTGS